MAILSGGRKGPKISGGRSRSADKRVPREVPVYKIAEQLEWRVDCLRNRLIAGTFTMTNLREWEELNKILYFPSVTNRLLVLNQRFQAQFADLAFTRNEEAKLALATRAPKKRKAA